MNEEKNVPAGNRSEQLAWLEMGVLTIAYPMVGFAIDRSNPFLIGYDFPWIAIPPVLIGLRHGFVRMAAGAATILGAMWLAARFAPETVPGYVPDSTMVGTLALGTLAGLFSDRHRQRLQDLGDAYDTVWERHEALARDFLGLEVSHERLARHGDAGRANLRDLLAGTEGWFGGERPLDLTTLGSRVLELVESYGLIEVASVHAVHGANVVQEPAAELGAPPRVSNEDPLIRAALETKAIAITHDLGEDGSERNPGVLLAVVPFVDVDGICKGVLAIHSMPFIAFEKDNLKLFSVLAGRIGDLLSGIPAAQNHDRRPLLELYVKRACQEAHAQGQCHALAVVTFRAHREASRLLEQLGATQVRAADRAVLLYDERMEPVLCVVLPMTDLDDAKVFAGRVDAWCQDTLGQSLSDAGGEVRFVKVRPPCNPREFMREILNGGHGDESATSSLGTDQPSGS